MMRKSERGAERETPSRGAKASVGRKCVASQIRLRNLCMKFTGGLVSWGEAPVMGLRIKCWRLGSISVQRRLEFENQSRRIYQRGNKKKDCQMLDQRMWSNDTQTDMQMFKSTR